MSNDHLVLTVPEAARLLRISRSLAYELVARGELPAIRLGRAIRIRRLALDSWGAVSASKHREEADHSTNVRI